MIASPLICSVLLAAAEEAGKAPNPLEFKSDTALWTLVVFAILLWVLWKYAWKPIADGLEKRERHIADNIAEAERHNEDARQILADYEKKLADSHQEVRGLLEQARRDAEKLGREMLARAKEEADGGAAAVVAADRGGHGRRLARACPAERDLGG